MKGRVFFSLLILKVMVVLSIHGQHRFTINLNDIGDDLFKVTLMPNGLTEENDIFQFAAIAPGTYQVMDVGRFVRSFVAYDNAGNELDVEQVSTNQWKLANPTNIAKIQYTIAETWDTPVDEHVIYNMAGTSLEEDHAFINHHCVLGYFHGMQSEEIWIDYEYDGAWEIGTPMKQNDQGYYVAATYDFVVDSPTLLGRLSKASIDVEGTQVDVFTYSKTDLIKSEDILRDIEDILFAASKFTKGLPVDRYVFLYHFEDIDYGAWEHSYSSIYAMKEATFDPMREQMFRSIAAHEFYHVVTPLNIHSEVVEQFNYETPQLSRHLWLYEGVTEWAAWAMQVRAGIMTPEQYLAQLKQKLTTNDGFDQDLSLTELGLHATEMADQYVNIYHKGAVTAGMLDLLLLKKSKGKMGLREVVNDLSKEYGPSRPFDETTFFDELVAKTYPEVSEFIDRYIRGTDPLPLDEYFGFVGIEYQETAGYDSSKVSVGLGLSVVGQDIVIASSNSKIPEIKKGDIIKSMDGVDISLANAQQQFGTFHQKKPGDVVQFTLLRGEEEVNVDLKLPAQEIRHQLSMKEKAKKKQRKLREKWLSNA
jgi:predicted metalloprotease with PDZ domain